MGCYSCALHFHNEWFKHLLVGPAEVQKQLNTLNELAVLKDKVFRMEVSCHESVSSDSKCPRSLKVGTRWRWVFILTLRPFYSSEKSSLYQIGDYANVGMACTSLNDTPHDKIFHSHSVSRYINFN
jgi:hypothetical protein